MWWCAKKESISCPPVVLSVSVYLHPSCGMCTYPFPMVRARSGTTTIRVTTPEESYWMAGIYNIPRWGKQKKSSKIVHINWDKPRFRNKDIVLSLSIVVIFLWPDCEIYDRQSMMMILQKSAPFCTTKDEYWTDKSFRSRHIIVICSTIF